jgi:hypothetical protein
MELSLLKHRQDRLSELLSYFSSKRYVSTRKWRQLLGELRSMALAIHSAKYLFSVLQHGLLPTDRRRVRLSSLIHQALHDWIDLLHTLHHHPVPITMLVPHAPHYLAAVDASIHGMGGFWLPTTLTTDHTPCIWRYPFDTALQDRLVSYANPLGDVCNSDLELAAITMCSIPPFLPVSIRTHTSRRITSQHTHGRPKAP